MKFLLTGIFLFILLTPGWAQSYPSPTRQTMWNNITDSVNTLGQSPQQKAATLKKLHTVRTINRMKSISAAQRAAHKAKMQAWLAQQNSNQ